MDRKLRFELVEIDATDGGSLALLFSDLAARCGIYWIDFADGSSYVGQSVSALSRLTTHRRRWSDAVAVRFADCSPERLDELERATITYVGKSRPLRNKLLTSKPGGWGDLEVETSAGRTLTLPWDRARRNSPGMVEASVAAGVASEAQLRALASLKQRPQYPGVCAVVATLLDQAYPQPKATQGVLWTLSAMPSTAAGYGQRLATLAAGRVEIAWMFGGPTAGSKVGLLNVAAGTDRRELRRVMKRHKIDLDVEARAYSAHTSVLTIGTQTIHQLAALVEEQFVLDATYALVVTMMRQGINPLGRHHNWAFARHLLEDETELDGGLEPSRST